MSEFDYKISGGTVEITKYKGNGGSIVIPSKIEGKPVTSIGASAFENGLFVDSRNFPSITIPEGVTTIGERAFRSCDKLKKVVLPSTVVTIGDLAFESTAISDIDLPASLTSIGKECFNFCPLKNINVNKGNKNFLSKNGVLFSGDGTVLMMYPMGRSDSDYSIPDGTKTIGDHAFENSSLKNITFPNTVEVIENGAFSGCENIVSLKLPDSIKRIGRDVENDFVTGAFYKCKNLKSINIPKNIEYIGPFTFDVTADLYDFLGIKSLPNLVITDLELPKSLKQIGRFAFRGC